MSKSKRACYVVFTATMLALASQAGAGGQATVATGDAAKSIHKGHVVGNAGNGKQEPVAADSELAAVTDKGHVVGHSDNGKQDTAGAAGDPACSTEREASRPASCPKAINKPGLPAASAAQIAPPAAPAPAERVGSGGVITGSVVIHNGSAKQVTPPTPPGPACTAKTADGKPSSCPKGINEAGLK